MVLKKCFWLLSCLDFKFWSCFLSFPCSYVNMAGLLCLMYPRKYLPAFLQWQSVALMQLSLSEILQLLTQRILNFFGHKIRLATSYYIVSCNPELQLTLCDAQLSESARIRSCPLYQNATRVPGSTIQLQCCLIDHNLRCQRLQSNLKMNFSELQREFFSASRKSFAAIWASVYICCSNPRLCQRVSNNNFQQSFKIIYHQFFSYLCLVNKVFHHF